jgi:hypothetical protein
MKLRHAFAGALAGLLFTVAAVGAQAPAPSPDGPWLGTWKRNKDKSTSSPPGESIFKMWRDGDGFRYTLVITPPDGAKPTHMEAFGRFDGKPYPETGNPSADHNVFTRLGDRGYGLTDIKDGKETISFKIFISPDNKTRTSISTSKNAKGEEVTSIGVWDRVQ